KRLIMAFDDNGDLSEFDWERRFREDDERLSSCMREIPAVIDLPGEDDLLRKRLQRQLSVVSKPFDLGFPSNDDFMDYDDIMFPENWRDLPEAELYDGIESLVRDWCALYSSQLSEEDNVAGVQALCLYGRLMGFAIDLVDMGNDQPASLKIALCKRVAKDLDRLLGIINAISTDIQSLKDHKERLRETREDVLKLLFQLRNENNANK
ncbi:MAG: hypothetical protein KAG97_05645, partial [Victivallales bacterium]|nr:hypothetical protein [Victivallales bacterium]